MKGMGEIHHEKKSYSYYPNTSMAPMLGLISVLCGYVMTLGVDCRD